LSRGVWRPAAFSCRSSTPVDDSVVVRTSGPIKARATASHNEQIARMKLSHRPLRAHRQKIKARPHNVNWTVEIQPSRSRNSSLYIQWSDVTESMAQYDRHFVGITRFNVFSWMAKIYRVIQIKLIQFVSRKCPYDDRPTNEASLRAISQWQTFLRVLPTRWRQKSTGIDVEQNYVTVTPCIVDWYLIQTLL